MAAGHRSPRANPLFAVLLVTRSRPGPRLVFHYPPNPQRPSLSRNYGDKNDADAEDDSDSDEEGGTTALRSFSNAINRHTKTPSYAEIDQKIVRKETSTDRVLGFSEDSLEKLLSPGRWCDGEKFEACLDGLTFVGHPMYADQDGSWGKQNTHNDRNAEAEPRPATPTGNLRTEPDQEQSQSQSGVPITLREPETPGKQIHDFKHVPESLDSQAGPSLATSFNSESTTSVLPEQLTMFLVVFVIASSKSERQHENTLELHQQVAKKLSKALRHCQKQSSYIGHESKKLLALKSKAKQNGEGIATLCEQMTETSELAWALKEVYKQIVIDEVAGIRLNGVEMSLHLAPPANKRENEGEFGRHSGLLLLEDKDILLRELAHPDASPLVYFIREHTPTKSLQKHAVNLNMAINDILYLARHLIKWRRARAITPLHPRNSYVLSPHAPLDQLDKFIPEYAQKFSALPSLPQILKILSGEVIKYGSLIPSRDHRAPYMQILAYLVRHKIVEPLKTYGWLQAPNSGAREAAAEPELNQNKRPLSVASLLSPQMRPVDDDSVSVSSERTAIPVSVADASKRLDDPTGNVGNGALGGGNENSRTFEIIKDPLNLSSEDAQRLRHIRESIDNEELCGRLPSLLRHFDGEHAFEEIAASEMLKSSRVEAWLEILQKQGFLLTFRHL